MLCSKRSCLSQSFSRIAPFRASNVCAMGASKTQASGGVDDAETLYDGVDRLWQALYGHHVHVGYYPNPDQKFERLDIAQDRTVDHIMSVAGLDSSVTKLLDIGCGTGGTSCYIAKKLGCKVVGVNISKSQVASANQLAQREGFLPSQVHFFEGDALDLPPRIGTAPVVLSLESACYMPDKRRFIQQLACHTQSGGRVVLVDFCRAADKLSAVQKQSLASMDGLFATASSWTSAQEYVQMLEAEGLTVTIVQDWSSHIRGFWEAKLLELFTDATTAEGPSKTGALQQVSAVVGKLLQAGYLVLAGGWPTIKMAATFLTASQQRIMSRAFGSGALKYQCIVATKP